MELIFRDDAYQKSCEATVTAIDEAGIRLDRTVFYPTGGGQPGDAGILHLEDGRTLRIVEARKGADHEDVVHIPDAETVAMVFDVFEHEGLCLGPSSGINLVGAVRLATQLGPGHTIVTLLCDFGTRYQSRLFNPAFLREKNLPVPDWLARTGLGT